MKAFLLFVILQSFRVIYAGSCEELESNTCSFCLQQAGCAWCSDVNYTSTRCNTPQQHAIFQCNMTVDGNPDVQPTLAKEKLTDLNQITPKNVSSKVRVGEPVKFKIEIEPSKNYPVDFYILMDLTATMKDDLDSLKNLALDISAKLRELTSRSKLAFGSFVDKPIAPYLRHEEIGKPFDNKFDIPYDYKHLLNFTDDANEFRNKINNQIISGNRDVPEGTFDALMQVAACEQELQWGSKTTTRRIVLIATDGPFHIAGEGRFGGIAKPNDAKCHVSNNIVNGGRLYDKSLELDYPTVNQVYQRLLESRIHPIFAIFENKSNPQGVEEAYRAIVKKWTALGATLGELDNNSSNIIELIEQSYNTITSTVQLNHVNLPENVKIEIKRNCLTDGMEENTCVDVKPGTRVSFDVSVTVTSCKYGNKSRFELSAGAFGTVTVDLDIICSCDCDSVKIPDSPRCNGNGSLVCGGCECDEGRSGEFCQCDAQQFSNIDTDKCKISNETGARICSGNGHCDCGVCRCNLIPGTTEKYYGQFCQCSNFNCEQSNNELCGGTSQGVCNCGVCTCKKEYTGSNCGEIDCSLFSSQCSTDVDDGAQVVCSNHGTCDCGKCKCDSFYEGTLCDQCPSCAGRCGDYKTCVLCKVFGVTPSNATLCANCPPIEKLSTLAKLQALRLPTTCKETDDEGCTYYYSYVKKANVTVVHVVENKDCPEGPDILLIVLAVIGGIVGIGIILLILWKLLIAMADRREYQKFERDRARSKWHQEKNPLYKSAVSTVNNPTFAGAKK